MSWQGTGAEAHLRLDDVQDAKVRGAWEAAAAARSGCDTVARALRDDTIGHGSVLVGDDAGRGPVAHSLKGLDSLRRKAATKMGPKGRHLDRVLAGADDLNRYTLTFPPESYTAGVKACYAQLRSAGYEPSKESNTWPDPVYKGLNTVWQHRESGRRFELQFHTPDSFRVKTENHELYELSRSGSLTRSEVDAANWLQHDRYQRCREVDGKPAPIEVPTGSDQLARPYVRDQLADAVAPETLKDMSGREAELKTKHAAVARAGVAAKAAAPARAPTAVARSPGKPNPTIPTQRTRTQGARVARGGHEM